MSRDYLAQMSETPEDILLEKERLSEITKLMAFIKDQLSEKAFDVLWLYTVEGWTQEKIADKYKVTQSAIAHYIKKISKKLQQILINSSFNPINTKELFQQPQSKLEAHSPEIMGWTHEFLQEVSIEGQWKYLKNGRKVYESKTRCMIPEYFEDCFYQGTAKIFCSICWDNFGQNSCTRLESN